MTQNKKIPCSVGILTFNSGKTLKRALESVKIFDDVIICDGGSTDNTLHIAREYNVRIIKQDLSYKNADGTLRDFSGVRNQTLYAARYDWFFILDSDEYINVPLQEEISNIVTENIPSVYLVPRLYVLQGKVIKHASTYPNRQLRFFNRQVVNKFIKEIHERIEVKKDIDIQTLSEYMYVPLPDSVEELRKKWMYYLKIEERRQSTMTISKFARYSLRAFMHALLFGLRVIRNLTFHPKTSLPMRFELLRICYQFLLVSMLFKKINIWKRK